MSRPLILSVLLIPLGYLRAQPIRPLADAVAVLCGDGDDLDVGIEFLCVFPALVKIKVKIRHYVNLVYKQYVADGEHERVL